MKILVADDDPQFLRALNVILTAHGYDIVLARTGAEALQQATGHHPDLVVLDLGMPRLDGIEVIEGIRGWSTIPILVVSGRTDSADKVDALDAGADDYVTKPFAADELLARIRALTRRAPTESEPATVQLGAIAVDIAARQVTRATATGPETVRLTPTEWQILALLLRHPQRLVTKQMIRAEVWGPKYGSDNGNLRLYLAQLRKKLEPQPSRPRYLLTEAGMGYRFVPDDSAEGGNPTTIG